MALGRLPEVLRDGVRATLAALPARIVLPPLYLRHQRRWPNVAAPAAFTEKLMWDKLHSRDPRYPVLADKLAVKPWVAGRLGPDWVIPTLWSGTSLPATPPDWSLPYVIKANHGSGMNHFVTAPPTDWDSLRTLTQGWLRRRFGGVAKEWHYSHIEPQLLVEPLIGAHGVPPPDYKLFVFDGKVACIQLDTDRFTGHRRMLLTPDWQPLPVRFTYPLPDTMPQPPASLGRMLDAARTLAWDLQFVRLDFYEVAGHPYFGEMTFTPNAGHCRFDPPSFDLELGRHWRQRPISAQVP